METINLEDKKYKTNTQEFISIYKKLVAEGALDDEQIIKTANDLLQQKTQLKSNANVSMGKNIQE